MISMKQNRKLSVVAAAMCMVASSALMAAKVEGLEKLERLGEYKDTLVTYHAAKPSREHLAQVSKTAAQLSELNDIRLNLDGAFKLSETRIGYTSKEDPSASFEIDRLTGNFLFNGGLKKYRDEESTRDLPAEGEAVELSHMWLQEVGLSPNSAELEIDHVGGLNLAVSDGKTGSEIFEKLKTVRFSRVLGGLPVHGDARIIMQLGERGSLAGMIYQWPEIGAKRKLSSGELMPAEKLRSDALGEIEAMAKKALTAELKEVELVLYDDGLGVMEPAYHIVMERHFDYGDKEPVMIPYDFYLPTTLEPQAFYPHMEVAELAPEDGRDEGETKNDRDE